MLKIIETKRLILRTVSLNNIETLHKTIFEDNDVVQYTFGSENFTLEQTSAFVKNNCNFDSNLGLSILIEKSSGDIIGLAGILECNYLGELDYEFGFILAKNYWGKGYAKEIGQGQIEYIKDTLKAKRVLALADENNLGSIKTIEKLNLKYFKTIHTKRGSRKLYLL